MLKHVVHLNLQYTVRDSRLFVTMQQKLCNKIIIIRWSLTSDVTFRCGMLKYSTAVFQILSPIDESNLTKHFTGS